MADCQKMFSEAFCETWVDLKSCTGPAPPRSAMSIIPVGIIAEEASALMFISTCRVAWVLSPRCRKCCSLLCLLLLLVLLDLQSGGSSVEDAASRPRKSRKRKRQIIRWCVDVAVCEAVPAVAHKKPRIAAEQIGPGFRDRLSLLWPLLTNQDYSDHAAYKIPRFRKVTGSLSCLKQASPILAWKICDSPRIEELCPDTCSAAVFEVVFL